MGRRNGQVKSTVHYVTSYVRSVWYVLYQPYMYIPLTCACPVLYMYCTYWYIQYITYSASRILDEGHCYGFATRPARPHLPERCTVP
jgi:hypothetical protein